MQHAVIMAGGAGTRLWPLSRRNRPKHFLKLFEGKSLMRRSFERLAGFLPTENINVITSAGHIELVADELPELPIENLIGEPAVRDTANAVGLSAMILQQRDPEGVMGIFTADQIIKPLEQFKATLENAYTTAANFPEALVTLGVKPTHPHTGYGYVRRGECLGQDVYAVREFKEKPGLEAAQRYVESGEYYWNSGMFVWRIQTILDQFKQHLPDNYDKLSRVSSRTSPAKRQAVIEEIYPKLEKVSIDYGVMEKAEQVLVCEMNCDWLDVGAWTSLAEALEADDDGHLIAHSNVIMLDSRNNIYVGEDDHLLATIGIEDVVIVRSPTATLVCHKDQVQKIKDLVAELDDQYL